MPRRIRIAIAGLFLVFLGTVAYWADTDTMPVVLREVYRFPQGDRVGHFVLYGLLAGLLRWAFPNRYPFLVAAAIAAVEEAAQLFLAYRSAGWLDLACGLTGIAMACVSFILWQQPAGKARSRTVYAALVVTVCVLGLASRAPAIQRFLPAFVSAYAGDTLWAVVAFLCIGFVWVRLPTGRAAVCAWVFAWLVEFSQLYHAPWLDAVRHTRVGGLVLGYGFLWTDLVCYTVGVILGVALERGVHRCDVGPTTAGQSSS